MESAEPERPNEQASHLYNHHRAGLDNLEWRLDNTQDNIHDYNDGIPQNSTWWPTRWSTWSSAFSSAIPPPSHVYLPNETTHNTTPRNLDRNTSLTGRKANNGFDKTKILLADQLMNRVASMNGSRSRTQATSCKDLTQDHRKLYEEAAESFIEYVKKLILQSEGPNQRVDDWMVMGFIDEAYTVPENGEKKPYLFGEWEYLWAIDRDDIATTKLPVQVEASPPRQSWREDCLWFPEHLIPTVEDWKWWCGEWKKVPGAIWEWKPTEEIWPWQRKYWAEAHVSRNKSGVPEDTS
ncbi:hypothetical protein sscle_01g002440 [Sclerotinia sclerotiorum 1980 UF-70]|uniref:Uncharacterized protein n=2 Tax=Sclerotinia sclerotiorum (strain ATCC 18683 / 1980 / Ss-1) TaxID=665079 RepID=A0A1D9PRZ5_SCLS1|nr:hypothetical protein sscle_01g002440 [Sclerotinia sclerotiorum 1980 UF-70]